MLSGRCLCDELITRAQESYRLWCVVVGDLETSCGPLGAVAPETKKPACTTAEPIVILMILSRAVNIFLTPTILDILTGVVIVMHDRGRKKQK